MGEPAQIYLYYSYFYATLYIVGLYNCFFVSLAGSKMTQSLMLYFLNPTIFVVIEIPLPISGSFKEFKGLNII